MIVKNVWILFFSLFSYSYLHASGIRKITYDDAIQIALAESYTVKYHKKDMDATHYSYLYTKADFKPILSFDLFAPSWSESLQGITQVDGLPIYNSNSSMQVGNNLSFKYVLPSGGNLSLSSKMYWENYRTTLSLSENKELSRDQFYSRLALSFNQPVFTANRLKENMRAALLNYQKSSHYFTRSQLDIIFNVTNSFYTVYKLAYEYQINKERLKNSKEAYRITKLKQEAGSLPEGEMFIAEITVAQDEARLMESEGKLENAKDNFKLLIGLDLNEEIELIAEMEFETILIDRELAIEKALQNRLEIQESNINLELQEIEIKRAKRERELKGNISAYYDFTGLSTLETGSVAELLTSSFENMVDRPANRGIVLTLSYPIADWGRAKNLVKQAESRLFQKKLDRENTERNIEKEIREIVRNVYETEKRYRINRQNQEVARKSYGISQLRFENGDMTSQELSIEQERLSQVQLAYIESYISYRLAVANLNRKTMHDFQNNQ